METKKGKIYCKGAALKGAPKRFEEGQFPQTVPPWMRHWLRVWYLGKS